MAYEVSRGGRDRTNGQARGGSQRPHRVGSTWALLALAAVLIASPAVANTTAFEFKDDAVHPACVLALVDSGPGARLPITLAISLAGCMAGPNSKIAVSRDGEDLWIEDDALLGEGGRFGYRALSRLENGIFAIAMRRVGADGKAEVSLAAVDLVERPMIRSGMVIQVPMLELLGIVPLPDTPSKSFRRVGNKVHVKAEGGPRTMDRTVDLTELGKARKKR